jgi:hypothetical protein
MSGRVEVADAETVEAWGQSFECFREGSRTMRLLEISAA